MHRVNALTRLRSRLIPRQRAGMKRKTKRALTLIAALIGAAMTGGAAAIVSDLFPGASSGTVSYSEPLYGCRVTDGDTIRCGDERIRLLGIDAPEMGGRCRKGRTCVEGDPIAAKESLAAAISGPLTIERAGQDRYGRTLAVVAGPVGDLSCHQLRQGLVAYRADWDGGKRVARICPGDVTP